jgi:hypothetical protein
MSAMTIEIDRLELVLHGVSAPLAADAAAGLESVLRRRLGRARGSVTATSVPQLRIGPLDLPPAADEAALRELVAERLLDALLARPGAAAAGEEDA